MHIILVPGLWLDGSSWEAVASALDGAGHRVESVTLPGMGSVNDDRSEVGLAACVTAVVSAIDGCEGPVIVVGHSAAAGIAYAAVDARPDKVARAIYVGGFPVPAGHPVAWEMEPDGADIPLPAWDGFHEDDLAGLDEHALASFRERAVPSPAKLLADAQELSDERRYDVPATIVCTDFNAELLQTWVEADADPVREIGKIRHLEYVDLPTGHWPQFSRPDELTRIIAERAVDRSIDEQGRLEPPTESGEVLSILGYLDYQRETLEWKTRGLGADGLNATTAASSLTLGGLLKHMAFVEDHWFNYRLFGRDRSEPWRSADWETHPDWELTSAVDDSPEELRANFRTAVNRGRALVAAALVDGGLDRTLDRPYSDDETVSLRWVLLHMIEEYARHNGHADLLRESIDGEVGE